MTVLRLDPDALDALDLDAAVGEGRPGNLFPSRVAGIAATENPRLISVTRAELASGYRLGNVEIVRVPKLDRTSRPAADMSQRDQVVYAALVMALRANVPPEFVSFTGIGDEAHSYRAFEEFPLTVEGATHVLEADAAAFYQYVDHERLAYELIGLTGDAPIAEALVSALEAWMGSPRGLPQGPRPSQPLADIYIAPAVRALNRAGFAVSRWSDDFRIPLAGWVSAGRAQSTLEGAFYDLGLVLTPGKLRTPLIETYRDWLEAANDPRVNGVASRAAVLAMEDEEYFSGDWPADQVPEDVVEGATAVLVEQMANIEVSSITTRLVRRSLGQLGGAASPNGLQFLPRLLRRFAHATPGVCGYLRAMMGSRHEAACVEAILAQLSSPALFPWQVGWLLHTLALASTPHLAVAAVLDPPLFDESLPWFARSCAALATAVHGSLPSLDRYFSVYERATDASRPDLVAAVVVGRPSWRERFMSGIGPDPLLQDIAAYPAETVRSWF